ncbi:MAG: hypothetical protein R8G01_13575 [Ilumatobacteraceae bacterium]|nr:hypothetical protein [Ilumatobacteraceae bacterium]
MLIKNAVLERIVTGEIDTLFRRQKRPTVKTGGSLRTRAGMLDIVGVERIELDDITDLDAKRAGFGSVAEVIAELTQKPEGDFYRVRVRVGGIDPRVELRERSELSDEELADVRTRLERLDTRSPAGAWTVRFMTMLSEQPHTRAPDLAASIGWETKPFKTNVAKLKALGLTISHSPGYELSPRGHTVLADLRRRPLDR